MSKELKIKNKAIEQFVFKTPLSITEPVWSTDRAAVRWNVGGFSKDTIPAGVYTYVNPYGQEPFLQRLALSVDNLIELPDDATTNILEHIVDFWGRESAFRALNFVYKRGVILYGPPGGGKSATIHRLAAKLEDHNAIMIMAQSAHSAEAAINMIKVLEPKRRIVVIFEDIDGIIRNYGDESLTHLLDGGTDVDGVLFIATTNYPERIPPRVLNRPSRFDIVIEIGMPSDEARRVYIEAVITGNLLIDVDLLVKETKGMGIASIKEVIILVLVFEQEITEAARRVRDSSNKTFTSTKELAVNSKEDFSDDIF